MLVAASVVLTTVFRVCKLEGMSTRATADPADRVPFDSASQRVFLHLWRTYDLLKAVEDRCLLNYGVSAQQYNVLRILRASHPDSVPTMELGRRLVSRRPDITRMLDRLNEQKLIERQRPEGNRRVVEVGITSAGLELLAEMDDAVIEMHERQLGHLKKKEKDQLIDLLRIVRRPHEDAEQG